LNPSQSAYDADLTDAEWEHLVPLVPAIKSGGRPPEHSCREILNGIFYAVRSGGAWKLLPHSRRESPPVFWAILHASTEIFPEKYCRHGIL
jgi:transposase